MSSDWFKHMILVCTLFMLAACGGGDDSISGVGGTGGPTIADSGIGGSGSPTASVTSTGTITGFGSIFVNGVEFFTTNTAVEVDDDKDALEDDLKLGMVVTVTGELDADGKTGTANLVKTEYEIKGKIENISQVDSGTQIRTFTILDNKVSIDRSGTVFHGQEFGSIFDLETIDNGDYVCMSGYTNHAGVILATHVEDLGLFGPGSEIILKGLVKNFDKDNLRFDLGTKKIKYKDTTPVIKSDSGIDTINDDVIVKIDGIVSPGSAIYIEATEIEIKDIVDFIPELWIVEGVISNYNEDDKTFELNDTEVDFSAIDVDALKFELDNDLHIEVTGTNVDDILVAESIKARFGDLYINGVVIDHDLQNKIITIEVIAGQPITVKYDSRTLIEDDEAEDDTIVNASSILIGDYAKIDAMDDNGSLVATIIKRETLEDDDKFKINAYLLGETSIDRVNYTLTLLDTTFMTSTSTEYELIDESSSTQDEFFAAVMPGDFISIEDESLAEAIYGDGEADKVKITTP